MNGPQGSSAGRRWNNAARGQSLLEVAVLGSLLVFALAALIRVGLRFNYQQQLQQDAFRKALRRAGVSNTEKRAAVTHTYNLIQDRIVPEPSDPFGVNSRTRYSGANTVTYGRFLFSAGNEDHHSPPFVFEINEAEREFRSSRLFDPDDENPLPLIAETRRTTVRPARGDLTKTETVDAITTTVNSEVVEQVTTTINALDGPTEVTNTLRQQTGRTWRTPH